MEKTMTWRNETDKELLARWRSIPAGVIGIGQGDMTYWSRVELLKAEMKKRGLL